MFQTIFSGPLALYLHTLPDFRGKWRALRAARIVFDGTPVRARYRGISLTLALGDRTNQLCVMGKHEPVVANAVATLDAGDCFIDVGANCGLYSIMASQRVGPEGLVVAFEPCRDTFGILERNLSLNAAGNVITRNSAVTDTAGSARFDTSAVGHSGRFAMATPDSAGATMVDCTRIEPDDPIWRAIGNRTTMVKVDVEGFEMSVLRGIASILTRPETRTVVVEVDDENLRRYGETSEAMYRLMQDFGFTPSSGPHAARHFDEVFIRPPA